jgi:imidazolonepropionase-like amidohydrolase
LFSINEVQSVSAEVRQEDVVNSEDINIYRQLAGGVTSSQLLHGSADCIGGQSALIKLKWGENPNNLLIKGADGFIKFALGENVKQGNSAQATTRFPATRMGVEQIYMDAFQRATEYEKAWKTYNGLANKNGVTPPKKDLELDALVEILNKKRFITCHSYVQSEINMMMKVAEAFNFNINTFTHILEGYKLADKMKNHGVAASTFSDWWAYKMEVKEAIPYNAAILTKMGVNTAINSDDAEMARRLNQEAAKTVLYGGVSEEDAWKMVTLNPAKMLHLDNRLGSIKVGKDADVVLWNNNPLSIYARPEKTIVDGTVYFDVEKDDQMHVSVAKERNRLMLKMLAEKSAGNPTQRAMPRRNLQIHCDTIMEMGVTENRGESSEVMMDSNSTDKK